jgi:hypothetical protein
MDFCEPEYSQKGESGELFCSKLSSELVEPDGDRAGVGQCGERDDQDAGMNLGELI